MKGKKGFWKQYISSLLLGTMILSLVLPNLSITANAQVSAVTPTTNVVTQSQSGHAVFTHQHKHSGSAINDKKVQTGQTVSGYSASGYCYTTKVQHTHEGNTTSGGNCYNKTAVYKKHTHTDSCKEYKDKYDWKDCSDNHATWTWYKSNSYSCPVCGTTHSWNSDGNGRGYYIASYTTGGVTYKRFQPWVAANGVNPTYAGQSDGYQQGSKNCNMYYDNENSKYVGVSSGGALWSCGYTNKIDGGYATGTYWTGNYICDKTAGERYEDEGVDYYTYTLKNPDPFYTGAIYTQSCGMNEGETYAQAWVSANSSNELAFSITKPAGLTNKCTVKYHVNFYNPDGSVAKNTGTNTVGSSAATDSITCTEIGTYKVYIHLITQINGQTVDDDEVTFTYTTVPINNTVNFYDVNPIDSTERPLVQTLNIKRGEESSVHPTIPTHTGYTFAGYYTGALSGTQRWDENGNAVDAPFLPLNGGSKNVYAHYSANHYTITYETNNKDLESVTTSTEDAIYNAFAPDLTLPKTYEGYTFLGWWGDADDDASTDDVQIFGADGKWMYDPNTSYYNIPHDLYLTAKYRANNYDLYYTNSKDEAESDTKKVTVPYNSDYELPDKTHTDSKGYTFLGWVDSVLGKVFGTDGANTDDGKWKYTQDVHAKATYEANTYTVTYYAENSAEETTVSKDKQFVYDSANPTIDAQKTYTGWTSDGYYEGTTKVFNADGTFAGGNKWNIDHDVTLTPKFTAKTYTLSYNLNKEESATAHTQTIPFNSAYGLTDTDKTNRKSYKGYTFDGWFDANGDLIFNPDGSNAQGNKWRFDENITATAKYTANQYTVTYYVENPAEETEVSHTDTFTFDAAAKLSTAKKTYAGWTFDGWYEGETKLFDVNGNYVNGTWDLDRNVVVTPKFTPISYTLSYDLERGGELTSKTILYNDSYGLSDTDKANRKSYKGYTFNGWFDADGNLIFNPDGSNTDTGIWRRTSDLIARTNYTANPYKVYYNTTESGSTSNVLDVVYDSEYALPADKVNSVPKIDGYTFDGWFLSTDTSVKVFNTNGTSVKRLYDYDHDITVVVKYHKNKYKIHFNNTDIEDNNLDQTQEVTFDETYLDIAEAPYKVGYVFDGHTIEGTNTFIWDGKGNITHAIWDFVLGNDGTEINATKHYSPKVFTVDLGSDFDNDGVIDSIEDTKTATYDAAYFDLSIPDDINGYTFDGWYLYGDNLGRYIATYDLTTKTLTKDSDIWVYDDGINWVNENHKNLTLIKKWHKNTYTVKYQDTTVADTNKKSVTVTFDTAYDAIQSMPYKTGYVGQGYYFKDINNTEQLLWNIDGTATQNTFAFDLDEDNSVIEVYKKYTPKTFTVEIGRDFDNDGVLDSVEDTKTVTFDSTYFTVTKPDTIPGYTFDGFVLLENDTTIFDKDLNKANTKWIWDDGKDWNEETPTTYHLAMKWHSNTYKVHYNTTTVDDNNLDENQTVVFDQTYQDIPVSPYKKGYIFDGHRVGTQYVWDKEGKVTHPVWDFAVGNDSADVNALKHYTAKTFTVEVGRDFNNDGVLDSVEQTETITYDGNYGSLAFDVPENISGYTFDGWYLIEQSKYIVDNAGIKASNTWTYDDGKDWNTETYNNVFHIALKWHQNTYTVKYNNTTVEDTTLDKKQTVIFDTPYADITVSPYKSGYIFDGHKVGDDFVWGRDGKVTHPVWDFAVGGDNHTVEAKKQYTAKQFTVEVGRDFNNDNVLDSVEQSETVTYDKTYNTLTFTVPEAINGYTFDGWYLIEQDKFIVSKEGTKTSNTWVYDDGKDWNTETYNNVFHIALKWHQNSYTVKYNDTTVADTNKVSKTLIFDEPYSAINTQPVKYGYTGQGWYFKDVNDVEQLIWNPDGTPAKNTFTFDLSTDNTVIEVYKKYTPNPHTVTVIIDNDPIPGVPPVVIPVVFDDPWKIPDGEPDKVPDKPGYTFDGWTRTPDPIPGVVPDPDIFVTPDGKPVDPEYHIDEDITLYPTYHKNSYTVRYNNTETEDTNLDKSQKVVYGDPYQDIAPSPYKSGYLFEGHYLDKPGQVAPNDPDYRIWDKDGKVTKDKYTFIFDDKDNAVLDTHKIYTPKLITVNVGLDYNEDKKIDEKSLLPSGQDYKDSFTMYFDDIVPDADFPIINEPGLTFTGWYLVGNDITGEVPLYTYDENTKTLKKTSDTWIWDDGKDWNKVAGSEFTVVGRFAHNSVDVTIKTETDKKTGNKKIGEKSDYTYATKERTEAYDLSYDKDSIPTKRGYTFTGYIVDPKNNGEDKDIWDKDAKPTSNTFRWLPTEGKTKVEVISTFTANTITGEIPTEKYDPVKDETTPNPTKIKETYDQPYSPLPSIPEKKGYDYEKITDKDGNEIWDKNGKPSQEVWNYIEDDIKDFVIVWKPKTYILVYPDKTEVTVTFDKAVNTNKTDSKSGHTFKGWTFKHNDKTIHAFGSDGKYNGSVWTYDFGKTGTKIPLSPVFDVNTYQITVKPMTEGYEPYTMEVAYGSAYPDVAIPVKKGYVFNGYDLEYNAETGELSKTLWDKDGKAVESSFGYTHNITVLGQYKAKTYYLHLGDKKVIKVTYDELVERGITLDKEGTEDDNYTYTYDFTGWYMKNGTKLFNDEGFPVYTTWTLDLGDDGTHIYLDGQFDENKVEKEKPQPEEEEEEKKEEPSDKPEETSETVEVTPEVKPGKDHTQALKVLKKAAVIGGLTIGAILLIGLLIFLILLILFLLGEISLVYRFDYNKGKKKLDGICKIHKYKKDERQDEVKFYVTLKEKYYRPLLDTKSKLISVRLAPHWVDRHHGKAIRIQCKDIYHDYMLRSSRNGKGDIDKGGYIELHLTESFN